MWEDGTTGGLDFATRENAREEVREEDWCQVTKGKTEFVWFQLEPSGMQC